MAFFSIIASIAAAVFTTANLIALAMSVGLQLLSSALRKKPKTDTGAIDAGQMVQANLSFGVPRGILFGQRDVGGVESDRFSYSTKNEMLCGVFVLSSRPCSEFVGLKVFGEPVTLSGDPTLGEVQVTSHFKGLNNAVRMYVRVFLGDDNSGFPGYINGMVSGRYNTTDIGGKMCIAVWRAHHTNDDITDEGKSFIPWTNGPPDCRWEMKGAKIFDPRVVGATLANAASWVYSENPVLQDFMVDLGIKDGASGYEQITIGNGYPVGLLDQTHVGTMADWADARNYGCHGVVRSGERGDQEEIWKTFNGQRLERPASVLTMPEAARPFYGDIDLTNMPAAKVMEYDEHGESTEVLNRMHGFYTEPDEGYGRKDLPAYTRAEWTAADGYIPREDELGLHFVTQGEQGLELIKQEAELTRHPATLRIGGLHMNYGETPLGVLIDLDGTDIPAVNARRWVVEQVSISSLGSVSIGLREWPGDANLALQATDVQPLPPIIPVPNPWPWWQPPDYITAEAVTTINTNVSTVTSDLAALDGVVTNPSTGLAVTRTELATAESDLAALDGVVNDSSTGLAVTRTELSVAEDNITGIKGGTVSLDDVVIKGSGSLVARVDTQEQNISSAAEVAAEAGGTLTAITKVDGVVFSAVFGSTAGGTATTNAVTVEDSNGTGTVSYAWSIVSGDAFTITSPTAATTTFSIVPGAHNSKTASAKCDITDSTTPTAQTFTVYITVSAYDTTVSGGGGGFEL